MYCNFSMYGHCLSIYAVVVRINYLRRCFAEYIVLYIKCLTTQLDVHCVQRKEEISQMN